MSCRLPQVVSDFGFFGRKKAEEFLESFEDTYYLRQLRISGDSIRCAPCGGFESLRALKTP